MLKAIVYGPVTRLEFARSIAGRGRYWTTAYYVDGLLVDTGCPHTAKELVAFMDGKPLAQVVNTHRHEDHIGANGPLQKAFPAIRIFAHPETIPVLANPRRMQPLQPYRQLMWGWPQPAQAVAVADGELIKTDKYTFEVLYTPGHSRDHICLYEAGQGWLFSGDLFVGGKDRALGAGYDIWQIIESLKKVLQLPIQTLYPGSARVRTVPADEIRAKIEYYTQLGERIRQLHEKGWSTSAIVREVCGRPMLIEQITLGHFSRRHLVNSFLSRYR